jgi:hypothetical protein
LKVSFQTNDRLKKGGREMSFSLMRKQLRPLRAGEVISFSAGNNAGDPRKFRRVYGGEDRLANVLRHFPKLASVLQAGPVIINCYPATLGAFPSAAVCDTYLRQSTFSRALELCSLEEQPAILLGQPLAVADLLFHHISSHGTMPQNAIICVGGYYCPASLETFLQRTLEAAGCHGLFFHAYGTAEVDFAVFVGERNSPRRRICYTHVAPHVVYRMNETELELRRIDDDVFHGTGDHAVCNDDGRLSIRAGRRLDPQIAELLESWTNEDWRRKTGYLFRCSDNGFHFQLRKGVTQRSAAEVKFGVFQDEAVGSFLDKPDWSISEHVT